MCDCCLFLKMLFLKPKPLEMKCTHILARKGYHLIGNHLNKKFRLTNYNLILLVY